MACKLDIVAKLATNSNSTSKIALFNNINSNNTIIEVILYVLIKVTLYLSIVVLKHQNY